MSTRYVLNPDLDSAELFTADNYLPPPGTEFNLTKDGEKTRYVVVQSWQEGYIQFSDRGTVLNKVLIRAVS